MEPNLNKALFWDIDINELDYNKHARFVIERVLTRGNLQDWQALKSFYGLEKIEAEALQIRYLDKITLNFCHTFFGIPKAKFRCYNTEPSIRQLWNY
ncbi:hypothetical protein C7N43_20420 [Sphingobacteriales bacterium UPWRP_1]|nr:hypothetical protein BVG80_01990 [Sphingobacteriales bacterium TSM_CSM]PSJ75132.1 hypothetical protein C7N43_20420 [Sphingobacteriales bacterium UPWRP_1]